MSFEGFSTARVHRPARLLITARRTSMRVLTLRSLQHWLGVVSFEKVFAGCELTTANHWDLQWAAVDLPVEVDVYNPYVAAIVSTICRYIPADARTIAELGAAPGGYLAFFAQRGLRPIGIDQSQIGCEVMSENWRLLGVSGQVLRRSLFDDPVATYDVVYSLGVIEHFSELDSVVHHHCKHVEPGGLLILGCPNFSGVYRPLMAGLAPRRLKQHNLTTMDDRRWDGFEDTLGLTRLFRGYVGGLEPGVLKPIERSGCMAQGVSRIAGMGSSLLRLPGVRALHSVNHRAWSALTYSPCTALTRDSANETRSVAIRCRAGRC